MKLIKIHAINEPRNFSNYQQQDFVEQINAYTKGKGVNVVLDMIGGDYLARNIKCMAFAASTNCAPERHQD
jgi:NADPH:quinone reductase-like Zn-dependent oxidoreductase